MAYDFLAFLISVIAIGISAAAYIRTLVNELPAFELVVDKQDLHHLGLYRLRLDNPMRHSVYLNHVEILKPDPASIKITVDTDLGGTIERVYDQFQLNPDTPSRDHRKRPIFLRIPPNGHAFAFVQTTDDPPKSLDFRLHWSTQHFFPNRFLIHFLIPKKLEASSDSLKSIRLAADTAGNP